MSSVSAVTPTRRWTSAEAPPWAFWLLVGLIFVGGLALRSQTFFELWTGVHNAWGGAFYGNAARNFVRYGYWATSFAPVVNSGVVDLSEFEIYYHHPPLSMWLTSLSFHAFGVHEWSARLAPLIFSLLTMGVVFVFASSAFGKETGLYALLFMAVIPVDAYYATHLDTNSSMAIFFTVLAVEAYRRWLISGRDRDYGLCITAVVLGCMTAWYTYCVIPLIVTHFALVQRSSRTRKTWLRIALVPTVAIAVFGLFLLHRELVFSGGQTEVYDTLAERVFKRIIGHGLNPLGIAKVYVQQFFSLYSLPFTLLTAAWIVFFIRDFRQRRLQVADWCIAILLSYGALYALAFPGHLPGHDFFVRMYAPGVALASAVVVVRSVRALTRPLLRSVATATIIGAVCIAATATTQRLYASDDPSNGHLLRGFGEVLSILTTPTDRIFLPIEDRVLQYYVDRPITFNLSTPEKLQAAAAAADAAKRRYLIVVPERHAEGFPELMSYLESRYPMRKERKLIIFFPEGEKGS
jgi:4-amino-4-deoxy-L-arabinose transferase-like glycosyltransferase